VEVSGQELYTQQTELQEVILGNNAVGRTLEINIKKEEDWTYWKFRPPPKRKKKLIKQQDRSLLRRHSMFDILITNNGSKINTDTCIFFQY
jgi:hypothetical protein